jgi:uncharacterized membrane protein
MAGVEETVELAVGWLRLLAETIAALVVAIGLVTVIWHTARAWLASHQPSYWWTRVRLSQALVLALEFQLAADILATSIAPDWATLGKLAIIAAIRTALNFFLEREIKELPNPQTAGEGTR